LTTVGASVIKFLKYEKHTDSFCVLQLFAAGLAAKAGYNSKSAKFIRPSLALKSFFYNN
jgi:hypothetical protein